MPAAPPPVCDPALGDQDPAPAPRPVVLPRPARARHQAPGREHELRDVRAAARAAPRAEGRLLAVPAAGAAPAARVAGGAAAPAPAA